MTVARTSPRTFADMVRHGRVESERVARHAEAHGRDREGQSVHDPNVSSWREIGRLRRVEPPEPIAEIVVQPTIDPGLRAGSRRRVGRDLGRALLATAHNRTTRPRASRVQQLAVSQGRARRLTATRLHAHTRYNRRFPSSECEIDSRHPLHTNTRSEARSSNVVTDLERVVSQAARGCRTASGTLDSPEVLTRAHHHRSPEMICRGTNISRSETGIRTRRAARTHAQHRRIQRSPRGNTRNL